MSDPSDPVAPDDDHLDGCEVDFADPAVASTDDDVDALLMFGDLPWVGERTTEDGRVVPSCDQADVERRIAELRELSGA